MQIPFTPTNRSSSCIFYCKYRKDINFQEVSLINPVLLCNFSLTQAGFPITRVLAWSYLFYYTKYHLDVCRTILWNVINKELHYILEILETFPKIEVSLIDEMILTVGTIHMHKFKYLFLECYWWPRGSIWNISLSGELSKNILYVSYIY